MSTFYAAVPDSVRAQQLVRHLLQDGIALDDISLVARSAKLLEGAGLPSTGDASYFVGRTDDPSHALVDSRSPEADYEAEEVSPVGGGISTSDRATDVDMVAEMENSQEAAEDETYPRNDTSHSRHELDDLDLAVKTGFPTPVTPLDNPQEAEGESERSLEPLSVPGVGVVIGGGDLATAAFDWNGKEGEPDSSEILTYLQDEGLPPETANEMLTLFGNGSAIVAVELTPSMDEGAMEDIAEQYGAVTTGWFGAPRY